MECGGVVAPGTEAADGLSISQLPVGKVVQYCVCTVAVSKMYMNVTNLLKSGDEICATHNIIWEAYIQGKVTTPPDAGRLPVKKVNVTWEILHPNDTTRILHCGTGTSSDAGKLPFPLSISDYVDERITNDNPSDIQNNISRQWEKPQVFV